MAKKTKSEALYAKAKPGGDKCGACRWFEREPAGGCEIVDGRIETDGWCKFFHEQHVKAAPTVVRGAALVERSERRRDEMRRARATG